MPLTCAKKLIRGSRKPYGIYKNLHTKYKIWRNVLLIIVEKYRSKGKNLNSEENMTLKCTIILHHQQIYIRNKQNWLTKQLLARVKYELWEKLKRPYNSLNELDLNS